MKTEERELDTITREKSVCLVCVCVCVCVCVWGGGGGETPHSFHSITDQSQVVCPSNAGTFTRHQ